MKITGGLTNLPSKRAWPADAGSSCQMTSFFTLFSYVSAYCTDSPLTDVCTILENIWDLLPSLRTDFTAQDVCLWVNSTLEESQALKQYRD